MNNLLYPDESYQIMGACIEVYKEKGCGFLEAVFQECLEMEFGDREVDCVPKPILSLSYKGRPLKQTYSPDFVCFGKIVLELKAVSALTDEHRAQVHNYFRATGHRLGLLVNFGHFPRIEYERIAL
ncbi:MAG: GxxExxY protein [Verrucomicrobia bacterium]|nr:GxxExxY protein [Verrucomicrobiota bacterium]